jgi:heme/copper-type cytochrome/quinol oxidase subunit 3
MAESIINTDQLPVEPKTARASGWWGMLVLIVTEAALFLHMQFSYYYLFSQSAGPWPPNGPLALKIALPNTFILIASSIALFIAERAIRKGRQSRLTGWLLVSILLGLIFVALQVSEWLNKPFNISSHAFGSLYYVITGFHMLHVAVGLVMLIAVLIWAWRGDFAPGRHLAVSTTSYYWHFVDVVWITVFFSFYLWPLLV